MAQEISAAIPASSSSQLKVVKFSDDLPTSQSSSQKLKSSKIRKAMRSEVFGFTLFKQLSESLSVQDSFGSSADAKSHGFSRSPSEY